MQVNRMTSNGLRGFQDAFSSMVDPQVQELHAGGEGAGGEETAHRQQGEGFEGSALHLTRLATCSEVKSSRSCSNIFMVHFEVSLSICCQAVSTDQFFGRIPGRPPLLRKVRVAGS